MNIYHNPAKEEWASILSRPAAQLAGVHASVDNILAEVKARGDAAIREFTSQFDQVEIKTLKVSQREFAAAEKALSTELKEAIQLAYNNILTFHTAQRENFHVVETMPGVRCWQKTVGIEKVGLYVPSGTAPLFSTVLMLGVPARIAGCREIVLCVPPRKDGKVHPAILYTAQLIGIDQVFKVGGAQAIGGMAYGTKSIPKVYKIFGPGNAYVTVAKQKVAMQGVAIDMPAGPSELMVVADKSMPAAYAAADLLSQAEHGTDSQVVLVTFTKSYLNEVQKEVKKQLKELPRKEIAEKALEGSSAIVLKDRQTALEMVNSYAPEHLIIGLQDSSLFGSGVVNAGSVFLGNYTPESVGDYASGTNHTLPTEGYARMYSGVSLNSFTKTITFQRLSSNGLKNLGKAVEIMAEHEELQAHKNAVSIRLKDLK